jgi:transposase
VIRGLMTDEEWAVFEPFLARASPHGGRPPKNHRKVLDGVLWINRSGALWRDPPEALGNWNSVHKPHASPHLAVPELATEENRAAGLAMRKRIAASGLLLRRFPQGTSEQVRLDTATRRSIGEQSQQQSWLRCGN